MTLGKANDELHQILSGLPVFGRPIIDVPRRPPAPSDIRAGSPVRGLLDGTVIP